ncbi:MAG: restriction endonuclease subunit S [Lachnospiraceae bacterium]|nr:MAG: restriction endonuclease subunit S [Lachnospiraceae bacterium]
MSRVPRIRFKGFEEDWEQRKLSSLCDKFTDGDWIEAKDQSNSGVRLIQTGNVGVAEYLDKPNNKKWISNDTFEALNCEEVFEGDILISRLPEPAGRACIIPKLASKMVTAVDCTIVRVSNDTSNKYLLQYLSSQKYFDEVNTCLAGGTRQRISRSGLANFDVAIPVKKSEQEAIGAYFSNLDHLITLHQSKSFKCFFVDVACCTLSWEQRKLGECFTERIESMPDGELISVTINDGVKKFSELGRHDNSNDDKSKYKKVCIGDIAYNSMRMWQGASGYSYYNGIVSPAYTVLSANYNVNSKFIAYQFKLPKMIHTFKINSQGITSDNWNLKFPALSDIPIFISKQTDEQGKIAFFLENLDHLITLHQLEPYYQIFKAIAYRIIDYAEYKFFNVKINLIYDIIRINIA